MTTYFATNKTFTIAGTTSDTMEPYVSEMGFEIVLRPNAFGGGSHFAVVTKVINTIYKDAEIDNVAQKTLKKAAKAEADERASILNTPITETAAA